MTFTIIKFICLFVGIWLSIVNMGRMKYEVDVPAVNTFFQALGITGFIFLQFLM